MPTDSLTTAATTWLWDNFGKEIADKAIGEAKRRWQQFNWKQAEEAYRAKIIRLYGTTRVIGQSEPISLEGIFTDVYILDKPTALRRFDISKLRTDPEQLEWGPERISGLELIKQSTSQHLFILGKPGAGKTTFLRYLTWQAAQGQLDAVPVFVSLKEWADDGSSLMSFIEKQFDICSFPDAKLFIMELLKTNRALVLFDGLDEVGQEKQQREQITHAIRDFAKQHDRCSCMITCRIAATDYTFEQFKYIELADFTDTQIKTYVSKWFQKTPHRGEAFLREFAKVEHRGLRELASSPLLLSMLCLSFDATMLFPHRRVEIYEEALEALLKKWDASKGIQRDETQRYRELTLGHKRPMFAQLAYTTFTRGDYFVKQETFAKAISDYLRKLPNAKPNEDLDGDAVLKAIEAQHGILVERAHHIYSFAHLTFQEYFTAKYIVGHADSSPLRSLLTPEHIADSRWHEVILLVASLLDEADHFFRSFLFAVEKLLEQDNRLIELLQRVKGKSLRLPIQYKSAAIRAFVLFLNLVGTHDRHPAPTLALALDLDYTLASDLAHDLALALTLDHTLVLDRDLTRTLALALARARPPKNEPQLDLALTMLLTYEDLFEQTIANNQNLRVQQAQMLALLSKSIAACSTLGFRELNQALSNLPIPANDAPQSVWSDFAKQLRNVIGKHRLLGHEWNLSKESLERLNRYLKANQLLVECLKLAVVSDKQQIEACLLLPPS